MNEEKFWCIWVEKFNEAWKYTSLEAAKAEAEKVARMNGAGHRVYILEKVAECEVSETPIAWK